MTTTWKFFDRMEDGEVLEDWMETKIAQAEQSVTSVVKAFMYDELTDNDKLDFNELIIGK